MKNLYLIFILSLFFINSSKANELGDLELEGISVGDSALIHFNKQEIVNNFIDKDKNNRFQRVLILDKKSNLAKEFRSIKADLENYNGMHIYVDKNDKKFIIYGVEGMLDYPDGYNDCLVKKKEIENSISGLFNNPVIERRTSPHSADTTGKSIVNSTLYNIDKKSQWHQIQLECFDWSESMRHIDHFRISILSDEVNKMIWDQYN